MHTYEIDQIIELLREHPTPYDIDRAIEALKDYRGLQMLGVMQVGKYIIVQHYNGKVMVQKNGNQRELDEASIDKIWNKE